MSICDVTDASTSRRNVQDYNTTLQVCRICLAMDCKQKSIYEDNLFKYYECITGLTLKKKDKLPKMLCWECVRRLKTANTFRDKALKSHVLLSKIAIRNKGITIEDIKIIDREENKLISTLAQTHYDFYIVEEDFKPQPIKEEFVEDFEIVLKNKVNVDEVQSDRDENQIECKRETSNKVQEGSNDMVVSNEIKIDRKTFSPDLSENVEVDDSCADDSCVDDTEMNEGSDVLRNDEVTIQNVDDPNESDVKLKPNNMDNKEELKDRRGNKKVRVIRKKTSTSEKKMQKNKIASAKKPQASKLSENKTKTNETYRSELSRDFTIIPVTFDEQIAEIKKRQKSTAYKYKQYKCTMCYTGFSSQAVYDAHCARHSEKKGPLECFVCKRRFQKPSYLKKHLTLNHTLSYSCNSCKFVTNSGAIAKEHLKGHSGRVYACSQCPEKFNVFTSYETHIRIRHPSPFVCNLCGYTFVSEKGVERHKLFKHSDSTEELKGPFCDKCDVRFASEEAFERHLQLSSLHKEDGGPDRIRNEPSREGRAFPARPSTTDPVSCELCGLVLAGYRAYTGHFRTSHPGKNRTQFCQPTTCMCEHCGKRFRCESLFYEHMNVHTMEEEYKCDGCERTFHDKAKLRVHKLTHRAVQFPCPRCPLKFTQRAYCTRHILKVHEGVLQFRCEICGRGMSTADNLKQHVAFVHHKLPRPPRRPRPS